MTIRIEISPGELADRLSILEIKLEHFDPDTAKAQQVRRELADLAPLWHGLEGPTAVPGLYQELKTCNQAIWDLEEQRRRDYQDPPRTRTEDFRQASIDICRLNDQRSVLRQSVNRALRSDHIDVKSHPGL